jgi:hypothetical protein
VLLFVELAPRRALICLVSPRLNSTASSSPLAFLRANGSTLMKDSGQRAELTAIKMTVGPSSMLEVDRQAVPEVSMTDHRTAHEESITDVVVPPQILFDYLDDPRRLGSHMEQGSWRTAGATMAFELDDAQGRSVGSQIRLRGSILGVSLELAEVVTEHAPPWRKAWRTIGTPRLLVIGSYVMGFEIAPTGAGSRLRVFIDYSPPPSKLMRVLPVLGRFYAGWCVNRMAQDAKTHFERDIQTATQRP